VLWVDQQVPAHYSEGPLFGLGLGLRVRVRLAYVRNSGPYGIADRIRPAWMDARFCGQIQLDTCIRHLDVYLVSSISNIFCILLHAKSQSIERNPGRYTPDVQIWTSCVNAFESYHVTDRQTDTSNIPLRCAGGQIINNSYTTIEPKLGQTRHWWTKQSIHGSQPLAGTLIALPDTCSGLLSPVSRCALQILVAMCWPQQPPQYRRSPPVNMSVLSCVQWRMIPLRLNSSPRQNSTTIIGYNN